MLALEFLVLQYIQTAWRDEIDTELWSFADGFWGAAHWQILFMVPGNWDVQEEKQNWGVWEDIISNISLPSDACYDALHWW